MAIAKQRAILETIANYVIMSLVMYNGMTSNLKYKKL
jgi:hypothetical protein